jgi:hypothetical protein
VEWPFEQLPASAVVTTTYVARDRMPILVVSRDEGEDGDDVWQFHCGNGDYDPRKLLLVRLDEILRIDPTIAGVAHLASGQAARRAGVGETWTITTEH